MKELSEMSDKEFESYLKTIKPQLPPWSQEGCSVLSKLDDMFVDRDDNQALIQYVYWKDKKKKQHKSVAWVKWE